MLGDGGFLGPTRDPKYGGLGLDFTYSMAIAEELGHILCAGVPMAIGVHTGGCGTGVLSQVGVVAWVGIQ